MSLQVARGGDHQIEGDLRAGNGAVQVLGGTSAMGTFRHYHQQVNIGFGLQVAAGGRTEQDKTQWVNCPNDLLDQLGYDFVLILRRAGLLIS